MTIEVPPPSARVEALLRAERMVPSQPDDIRDRVLRRARSAMDHPPVAVPRPAVPRALIPIGAAMLAVAALGVATYPWTSRGPVARPAQAERTSTDATALANRDDYPLTPEPTPATARGMSSASPNAAPPERSRRSAEDEALELRLLERARRALRQRDYADAWSALAAHERQFPRGRLAEEREALKVTTLTGLGKRDDARRVAAEFRKRFPQSVLLSRMDDILNGP